MAAPLAPARSLRAAISSAAMPQSACSCDCGSISEPDRNESNEPNESESEEAPSAPIGARDLNKISCVSLRRPALLVTET
jgi:hypothetical protein